MLYRQSGGNILAAMIIAVFCITIATSCSDSGEKEKTPVMNQLAPSEIMGWKAQEMTEKYDRETIFDYINGAGEVYLSYNFQGVTVTRFSKPEAPEITVEVFDMNSAEDAYGVFTHSRESEETGIGQGYEYRGSLLSFWQGRYFVCVLSEQETPEAKEAVFALARAIDENIPASGGKPDIVQYLPEENLGSGDVRFFHSHPSLNYHYFLAEQNILNLGDETDAVLGRYKPGRAYLLCIQYPTSDLAEAALNSFIDNYIPEAGDSGVAQIGDDNWVGAATHNQYLVIALDAASEDAVQQLIDKCMQKMK